MPVIRPEVQQILRDSGLLADATPRVGSGENLSIKEKLSAAGLSEEELLEEMSMLLKTSSNESLRARLIEDALKVHGAMKDTTPPPASFIINIHPSVSSTANPEIGSLAKTGGVNPILIPRQLLNKLGEPAAPAAAAADKSN